jgi:hypothetical protein
MVWLYRSPVPMGGGGVNLLVYFYLPSRARRWGRGQHPVASSSSQGLRIELYSPTQGVAGGAEQPAMATFPPNHSANLDLCIAHAQIITVASTS